MKVIESTERKIIGPGKIASQGLLAATGLAAMRGGVWRAGATVG